MKFDSTRLLIGASFGTSVVNIDVGMAVGDWLPVLLWMNFELRVPAADLDCGVFDLVIGTVIDGLPYKNELIYLLEPG